MKNLSLQRPEAHITPWKQMRGAFNQQLTTANVVGLLGALLAIGVLIGVPMPWNIRLTLYLMLTLWTFLRPRVALYLLPLSVPWGALDYINAGPLRLNSTDILVPLLAIAWLLSYALRPSESALAGPRDRVALSVPRFLLLTTLALLGTMALSISVATSLSSSLKEIFKWLEFLVIFLLALQYLRTRRQIWTLAIFFWIAGLSQAILGYFQKAYNLGPIDFIRNDSLRVYGSFGQPNPYAGYINLSLSVVVALVLLGGNKPTRIAAAVVAGLLGGAEILTQSKGGWVALGAATLFILIAGIPLVRVLGRFLFVGLLGFIGAILAGVVSLSLFSAVSDFVGLTNLSLASPNSRQYATAERIAHWIAGIRMFQAHPWLGVGIGNYGDVYSHYYVSIFVLPLGHAHNYFINVAAEMGIIGLIVYTLFNLAIFSTGGHAYKALQRRYQEVSAEEVPDQTAAPSQSPENKPYSPLRSLLRRPFELIARQLEKSHTRAFSLLANDRALVIGLIASLITIFMHNMVDDLYVQGMTTLMALLLAMLIRLGKIASEPPVSTGELT